MKLKCDVIIMEFRTLTEVVAVHLYGKAESSASPLVMTIISYVRELYRV